MTPAQSLVKPYNPQAMKTAMKTMNATNYHNEEVTFAIGQNVTHVTDEGEMISATITGLSDGFLNLDFEDGNQGRELPDTCF